MKTAVVLLLTAAAWSQAPLKPVSIVNPAEKPAIPTAVMTDLEKRLDYKVSLTGGNDPILLLGPARTLYVSGFGAIVTQEISLVVTPTLSPFHQQITPQEIVQTHQRKIDRLPLARQTIREMWTTAASMLTAVPEDEQIVVAVRLLYQPWENTAGLPGQIVVKASRKTALAGVQTEEQ